MIGIGIPTRRIILGLVSPYGPPLAGSSGEQFKVGAGTACLYDGVLFIGLSAVLPFL